MKLTFSCVMICMLCWILMCLMRVVFCLIMSKFCLNAQSPRPHVTVLHHPRPQPFRHIAWLRSPSCVGIMLISHLIATCVNFTWSQILQQLINLESYSGCNVENLELIYRQIADALKRTSDETISTCKKNF